MDEIEKKLVSYIKEMNIAKMTLSQLKGIDLESIEIQIALCKKLNIQNIEFVGLLDKDLTSEKMIDLLCDYDFKRPNIIGQIELDESILPEGTPKLFTEQTIKIKGEVWMIHKNDADPFPSNPHAHNYDSGFSLHLGTGEFFKKREPKGFLNCKKLILVRDRIKGHRLPSLDKKCS
ncbi:MAG: hypothetical protein HN888_00970 [Desulfobacula sp.]|jgi:hypothetical protein|nr:hypothetical protein [Desulfobacula sp.]